MTDQQLPQGGLDCAGGRWRLRQKRDFGAHLFVYLVVNVRHLANGPRTPHLHGDAAGGAGGTSTHGAVVAGEHVSGDHPPVLGAHRAAWA